MAAGRDEAGPRPRGWPARRIPGAAGRGQGADARRHGRHQGHRRAPGEHHGRLRAGRHHPGRRPRRRRAAGRHRSRSRPQAGRPDRPARLRPARLDPGHRGPAARPQAVPAAVQRRPGLVGDRRHRPERPSRGRLRAEVRGRQACSATTPPRTSGATSRSPSTARSSRRRSSRTRSRAATSRSPAVASPGSTPRTPRTS